MCKDGLVHFGFHDRAGRQYLLQHQRHFLGPVGRNDRLEWTLAKQSVLADVPNIPADISFPIYVDSLLDRSLIVSCFGNSLLYRVFPGNREARLFVDGSSLGMKHAGNCVVDDEGYVWLNEVDGCRVWKFDREGKPKLTLGDGTPGFQNEPVGFDKVRFNWIYDIRKGPDGNIYVLDSKNFAVRIIQPSKKIVTTIAGSGKGGYSGDGGKAINATFGSDPNAKFDGPISLSLDKKGNIFVGDRHNGAVRMIHKETGIIETIAGNGVVNSEERNDPKETNPLKLNLPKISSMDYFRGHLFVPTDLTDGSGDLAVLRRL